MNRRLSLLSVFVLGLGLSAADACIIANPNHCFNLAIDTNAWCAAVHPDQPYCSPCEAENNGCVADEPNTHDCPAYTAPAGTESGTAGTETAGTETGGTETAGTETGTSTSG